MRIPDPARQAGHPSKPSKTPAPKLRKASSSNAPPKKPDRLTPAKSAPPKPKLAKPRPQPIPATATQAKKSPPGFAPIVTTAANDRTPQNTSPTFGEPEVPVFSQSLKPPAPDVSLGPLGLQTDDASATRRSSAKTSRGRRNKKRRTSNAAMAWWLVGGSIAMVVVATGAFFMVRQQREIKRLAAAKESAATQSAAMNNAPNEEREDLVAAPTNTVIETAEADQIAAELGLMDQEITSASAQPESSPVAASDPSPASFGGDVPSADVAPTGERAPNLSEFQSLVRQFAANPWNDSLHESILTKSVDEAWTELNADSLGTIGDQLRSKYLLLRLRYFLGDKPSTKHLRECSYTSLVSAAKSTFWDTDLSADSTVFFGVETVEKNEFHNSLKIVVADDPAQAAAHVEMIRQQSVLFSRTDQSSYFVVNLGRHVYTQDLKRVDSRDQITKVPPGTDVPKIELNENQVNEWSANNFRFPVWAHEYASESISKHFGTQAPSSRQWQVETFALDGKLVRGAVDMQSRVLD